MSAEQEAFLAQLQEYVRWCAENRTSPRVSEFASRLGMSRSALNCRASRCPLGNLGAELRKAQIEFAKELLCDPHLPLCKVAEAAGFTNERSFYRAFLRITKETPGAYRRRLA